MTNTRQDLDRLFRDVLEFARHMLAEHGEFLPFAGAVRVSGEVISIGADVGEEHPPSRKVIDALTDGLSGMASRAEVRAIAICFDSLIAPPGEVEKRDAIACRLEHSDGEVALVYVPYVLKPELTCEAPFRVRADGTVFGGAV